MKAKKIILGCFLLFSFFFFGSLKVDAATYKYCEYKLDANFPYNEDGKTIGKDTFITLIYKDSEIVSLTYDSIMYHNAVYDYNFWEPKLNGGCPDTLESNRAYYNSSPDYVVKKSNLNGLVEADWPFEFKKTDESKVYNITNTLSCDYEATVLGDRAKNIPFFYRNGDKLDRVNNIINITFDANDLFHPKAVVDTSEGSPTNKTPEFYNRLLEVLAGNYISKNDDEVAHDPRTSINHPTAAYKYLLDSLESGVCPAYMMYNQPDGYYIADWELSTGGVPNLKGVDNDYNLYKVNYSKYCAKIKEDTTAKLNGLSSKLATIETELDSYITNKNLTQEQYDEYQNVLLEMNTGLENSTGEYSFLGDLDKDYGENAPCSGTGDFEEIDNQKTTLVDKTDESSPLTKKLEEANNVSTVLSEQQKQDNLKSLEAILNELSNNFGKLKLGNNYEKGQTCESIFNFDNPDSLGSFLQRIFDMVKLIAPILVILFGSLDFGKAVISSDQEELKKAQSRFIKRCIAAVALFFLPTIINLLLEHIDATTCNLK